MSFIEMRQITIETRQRNYATTHAVNTVSTISQKHKIYQQQKYYISQLITKNNVEITFLRLNILTHPLYPIVTAMIILRSHPILDSNEMRFALRFTKSLKPKFHYAHFATKSATKSARFVATASTYSIVNL